MSDKTLPPWPEKPSVVDNGEAILFAGEKYAPSLVLAVQWHYQRALAAAWEARARLAVEALRAISEKRLVCEDGIYWDMNTSDLQGCATEAIETIGDLPTAEKGG